MTPEPIPHPAEGAVEVLRSLEWSGWQNTGDGRTLQCCPTCRAFRYDWRHDETRRVTAGGKHLSDCRLAAALTPDPAKAGQADEVAGLRADLSMAADAITEARKVLSKAGISMPFLDDGVRALAERATAAEARNKVLEEALRPFQGNLIGLDGTPPLSTDGVPVEHSSNDALIPVYIKVEDRRRALRARSALSQAREGGEHGERCLPTSLERAFIEWPDAIAACPAASLLGNMRPALHRDPHLIIVYDWCDGGVRSQYATSDDLRSLAKLADFIDARASLARHAASADGEGLQ